MVQGKLEHLSEHISKKTGMNLKLVNDLVHKYWDLWKIGKINELQFYGSIIKDLGIKIGRKNIMYDERAMNSPDMKVISLIKKLKKRYLTVALTNNVREWFEDNIVNYDLWGVFNCIITSYETKKAKPDREIYGIMLRKAGVKADECVFVDDQRENTDTAEKMGMKIILYRNYRQLFEELRAFGVDAQSSG